MEGRRPSWHHQITTPALTGTSGYGTDDEEEDADRDYDTEGTTDGLRPEVFFCDVIGSVTREEGVQGRMMIR